MGAQFDAEQKELLDLLKKLSYRRRQVILSSGRESDFYIDCKQTALHPKGALLCGRLLVRAIREATAKDEQPVEAVGGPTLGADPLATSAAIASLDGKPLFAFIIRKEPKKHGTAQWIEGADNLREGMRVAVVEDVVTTGASTISAVEKAEAAGLVVSVILCLVDREEGGREAIEAKGYRVVPLFRKRDFEESK